FIAVNLLRRISDAGQLTRALFVCDRDELRKQALGAFQNVFGSDAAEVFRKADGTNNAKNARIHIATYQTLGVENEQGDANFLTAHYPGNYFTHIGITKAEIIARHPVDAITGQPLTPEYIDDLYERYQFEGRVLLPDRVLAMCKDFFNYLRETGGPEQKTIIFCARDRHADDVAVC